MNADFQPYDGVFYDFVRNTSLPSAAEIVPPLVASLSPRSVVDVGCGEGAWLSVFARENVGRILGIDGDYVNQDRLLIPRDCFMARDLSKRFALNERFDLAISLEVAEHLPESAARPFTASLSGLAPAILFSAGVPGQGGTEHINEQWPSYWAALFAECEFDCFDFLRQKFWNDDRIAWWYRQNVLLFAKRGSVGWQCLAKICDPGAPADLIHPALWTTMQQQLVHAKALAHDLGLKLSVVHILRAIMRRFL